MTQHRIPSWLDSRIEATRTWVAGKNTRGNRVTVAVLVLVLFGLAVGLFALTDSWDKARSVKRDREQRECIVQLQQATAQRAEALTKIQNDDRNAQRQLNARWARDVITGNIRDIPVAYEEFRQASVINDRRRAQYGTGIQVINACNFKIVHGPASSVPRIGPHTSTSGTTTRPTGSKSSSLPILPTEITRTAFRTSTTTATALIVFTTVAGPTVVVTTTRVPAPISIAHTRTVFATRTATRTRTVSRPGPTRTVTVTRTRTVTITVCVSLPVLPSPTCT